MTKEFFFILIGTDSVVKFFSLVFFALLGVALSLLLQTTKRDPQSVHTPFEFSWKFLWNDNVKRVLAGIVLIFVFLRFAPQLMGVEINEFWALAIGFCSDKLAEQVKIKTNWFNTPAKKEAAEDNEDVAKSE